jgi:exonuclease V gamma subunit
MEHQQLVGRLRRGGHLPAGRLGEKILQHIVGEAEPVVDAAGRIGVDIAGASLPVHVNIQDFTIVGRIEGVSTEGLRRATYSKMKVSRTLRLWLDHLLVAATLQQAAGDTRIVGRLGKCTTIGFRPIDPDDALEHLTHLLQWYLAAVRVPLPLFPAPVDRAIEQLHQGKFAGNDDRLDDRFLREAEDAFQRSYLGIPDAEKASVCVAFAGREPFRMTCQEVPGLEKHDQKVPEREEPGEENLFLYLVNSICRPMLPYIVHQEQGPSRGRDV